MYQCRKILGYMSVFVLLSPLAAGSQTYGLQDSQLSDYLLPKKAEQLSLLERLVNTNSGTLNIEGVLKVGKLLEPEFQAAGFSTRWIELPAAMQRAGMLVAERKGTSGKKLLLIGHLDTVFPKDSPFQTFERQGRFATGPGIIDNKGGVVVLLYALKALHAMGALDNASITVVLTGDEENSGKPIAVSRQPLIEMAKASDVVLDFEPTVSGHASVGRRGTAHWLIEAAGREGHSSIIFSDEVGAGASFELARILDQLRKSLVGEPGLTVNPGTLVAGVEAKYDKASGAGSVFGRTNLVAQTAIASGDVRYLTTAQKQQAEARMAAIVKDSLPGTTSTLQLEQVLPPMPSTASSLQLFERYSQISQRLGHGPVTLLPAELRGGGDISYVAPYVSTALVGIGASGDGEHSARERLDVESLFTRSQLAALLMLELVKAAP